MVSKSLDEILPEGVKFSMDACTDVAHKLVRLHDKLNLGEKVPEVEYSKSFLKKKSQMGAMPTTVKLPGLWDSEDSSDVEKPKYQHIGKDSHLLFLILSTAQDASKQSNAVYRGGMRLLEDYSYQDLVREMKDDESEGRSFPNDHMHKIAVKYFGASEYNDPGKILKSCLEVLESYGGKPKKMIDAAKSPDELRETFRKIHGIGQNISSLLLKNLVRFGYYVPEDPCDLPIKIDRHALRTSFANGVITFTGPTTGNGIYRGPIERVLENAYREVCRRDRLSPIALDDAKWRLGYEMFRHPSTPLKEASGLKFNHDFGHPLYTNGDPNINYYIFPSLPNSNQSPLIAIAMNGCGK